ncbi:MAG: FecR family protein [Proteiniphilum sp.]
MFESIDNKQLIGKYLKGKCTDDELNSIMNLLQKSNNSEELRNILSDYWENESTTNEKLEDTEEVLRVVLNKIHDRIQSESVPNHKDRIRKKIILLLGTAAIIFLTFLSGIYINYLETENSKYQTFVAPKGSISKLILPDSTLVYLNSDSEIRYFNGTQKKKREVFLKGEAWFDVTKNAKKPFIVHTSCYQIQVLGTKFNVKDYPENDVTSTTLEEGKIQIRFAKSRFSDVKKQLVPGEHMKFSRKNQSFIVEKVNTYLYTSWKENKIVFNNLILKDLIVLLEQKYDVNIEVRDDVLLHYHYDGIIKNESIVEVLDLLSETLPIEYKILDKTIYLVKK